MRELTKDEMVEISGGLGIFDTTAWGLGALSDAFSAVTIGVTIIVCMLLFGDSENYTYPF